MNDPDSAEIVVVDWRPPQVDIDRIVSGLEVLARICAIVSIAGAVLGLVMLIFGSPRALGVIAGGVTGFIISVVGVGGGITYLIERLP